LTASAPLTPPYIRVSYTAVQRSSQQLLFPPIEAIYYFKHRLKNLLPSVNYDALNNSFNVGFSLTGLANYYQQKRRNQIELAKLENSLSENLENKIEKLDLENAAIKADLNSLENDVLIFEIDVQLYEIAKGKYKNSEISTEDFLQLKKAYLTSKNSLKNKLSKLLLNAKKIEFKTKN
jgi:hypothetical protein